MKSAKYPVSADGRQRVLRERIRGTWHPLPSPSSGGSASLVGTISAPRGLLCWPRPAFWVRHQPPFPLPMRGPYPGAFCAFRSVPPSFSLEGQHRGRRQRLSPFFGLNSTRFSSVEVGAFRCAPRRFLESTRSQSCLRDFSHHWGEAIY